MAHQSNALGIDFGDVNVGDAQHVYERPYDRFMRDMEVLYDPLGDEPPPYDAHYPGPLAHVPVAAVDLALGHFNRGEDLLDLNPPPAPRLGYIPLPEVEEEELQYADVLADQPAEVASGLHHTNPLASMDVRCLADRLCWITQVAALMEPAFSTPTGPVNLVVPMAGGFMVTVYPGASGVVYVADVLGALCDALNRKIYATDGHQYSWLEYLPIGATFNGLYDIEEVLWELPPGSPTQFVTYVVSATIPY